jgi:GNAT superfamily N-acetyltransferase
MAEDSHAAWVVRDYRDDLFERCLRLLESTSESQHSTFALSELLGALRDREPAVVALHGEEVLGAAIGMVAGSRGWVARLAIHDGWRGMGIPSALLAALEAQFLLRRVQHVSYVLAVEEQLAEGLVNAGYERRGAVAYFEKTFPLDPSQAVLLDKLGGFMTPASQWETLGGMAQEKDLIERRVLAPLLHPEAASRHGVRPPRAIMLFGPPGTGKTSFARGVSARLHWPFVELLPSRLASEPNELANALREVFSTIAELDNVVVFWDEI